MTTEREWAEKQISTLSLSTDQKSAVRNLLNVFWTARDVRRLSKGELESVITVFTSLSKGTALVSDEKTDEVWMQAAPGRVHMRDIVRVRSNAYAGQDGINHNGRVGVVVGIRPDDIRVKYTDDGQYNPPYTSHRTQALEMRVR